MKAVSSIKLKKKILAFFIRRVPIISAQGWNIKDPADVFSSHMSQG